MRVTTTITFATSAFLAVSITASATEVVYVNVLGDRDFFGFGGGQVGVDHIPAIDTLNQEPTDPEFSDRDIRRSNPISNDASWLHDYEGFIDASRVVRSVNVSFAIAGMQQGVEGLDNRLFVEGIQVPGAFDGINLGANGTILLSFALSTEQVSSFSRDYRLSVRIDGDFSIFGEPDSYYLDYATAAVSTVPALAGDYDLSGEVDSLDYQLWVSQFGTSGPEADGNGDGIVDAADYTVWRDNVTSVAVATVPEPTGAMVTLAIVMLASRRRSVK